jgi:hypothetical protein
LKTTKTSTDIHHIYNYGRANVIVAPESAVTKKQDEFGVVYYEVTRSATVRSWGTTKGLSELCVKGPLSPTVLDANPCTVYVPYMAIHDRRECTPEASQKFEIAITKAYVAVLGG